MLLSGATSAADQVGDAASAVSQDLSAGAGNDVVFDNTGDTEVEGGDGNDVVVAIGGNGTFTDSGEVDGDTDEVNDFFCGGVWDDKFDAGSGNDILVGDIGSDRHYGNDTLNGGADNDLLQGG